MFGAQYDAFSIFIFVFYLANPLKWYFSAAYSFSIILVLRIVAIILWLFLLFWRWWPKNIKKYLPLFWHFALFYHLPFRTTFSTLYSSHSPSFDSFGLLGIAALAILVDEKAFCILITLGISCGIMVYFTLGGINIALIKLTTLIYAILMVISIMFIKLIFFRNHHTSIYEKNKAYKILATALAHELRNPIVTQRISCQNLKSIKNNDVRIITHQSNKALKIIDSILLQVKYLENSDNTPCTKQSLKNCINLAINDDYFSDSDRSLIDVNISDDYVVLANKTLLIQVFTNLIKNALSAIYHTKDGIVSVDAIIKNNMTIINFYDNGKGITTKDQVKLFTPFFSNKENGVGLGLAFCKLAIEKMDGSIRCDSVQGKYTKFIIHLSNTL